MELAQKLVLKIREVIDGEVN